MSAKIEVLYKLLFRKRFKTEYHCIEPDFKCQEGVSFKVFCMKERLGPHVKTVYCPNCKGQFVSLWSNLDSKIICSSSLDEGAIPEFIKNLKPQERHQLLLGGLVLPSDQLTNTPITRLIA